MLHVFIISWVFSSGNDLTLTRQYEREPESLLMDAPYSVTYDADGNVYVSDRKARRIHVWNSNGKYSHSFGGPGQGPTEFRFIFRISSNGSGVSVYSHPQLWFCNAQGEKTGSITTNVQIQNFVQFSNQSVLYCHYSPNDRFCKLTIFELKDKDGKLVFKKEFPNTCYIDPEKGLKKAFCANWEIQRDGQTALFGYSETNVITRISMTGEIMEQKEFKLPTPPPNEADLQLLKEGYMSARGEIDMFKDYAKYDTDSPKPPYTHFMKRGNKIVFVTTPLGNIPNGGLGYWKGSYLVCDWQSGKILMRGQYELPETSTVIFHNGRIFAIVPGEDDAWQIWDAELKGLEP